MPFFPRGKRPRAIGGHGGFRARNGFTASLHLTQWARLMREPRAPFQAVTWNGDRVLGFAPTAKLSAIGRAVQDRVDEFIRAYLAVNPRR